MRFIIRNVNSRCSYSKENLWTRSSFGLASRTTALTTLNDEMEDTMKIIKSLEESGFLIKGLVKKIKMRQKHKKSEFLSMLLEILAASILGNVLARKRVI